MFGEKPRKVNNSRAAANMSAEEIEALVAQQLANPPPNWARCGPKQRRKKPQYTPARLPKPARRANTVEGRG